MSAAKKAGPVGAAAMLRARQGPVRTLVCRELVVCGAVRLCLSNNRRRYVVQQRRRGVWREIAARPDLAVFLDVQGVVPDAVLDCLEEGADGLAGDAASCPLGAGRRISRG